MRQRKSIFRFDPNGDPVMNTTPLIDVMLVILVMFIITIPPPTHSVDIDLPTDGVPKYEIADENRVTIDRAGTIRWNGAPVDVAELRQLAAAAAAMPAEPMLLLQPDADAHYLRFDEAVAALRRGGATRIGFPGISTYRTLI